MVDETISYFHVCNKPCKALRKVFKISITFFQNKSRPHVKSNVPIISAHYVWIFQGVIISFCWIIKSLPIRNSVSEFLTACEDSWSHCNVWIIIFANAPVHAVLFEYVGVSNTTTD